MANALLPSIPESELSNVARFLESQGYKEEAIVVSRCVRCGRMCLLLSLSVCFSAIVVSRCVCTGGRADVFVFSLRAVV